MPSSLPAGVCRRINPDIARTRGPRPPGSKPQDAESAVPDPEATSSSSGATEPTSSWADLPDPLLETLLAGFAAPPGGAQPDLQALYAVVGTCTSWRTVALPWLDAWSASPLTQRTSRHAGINHPNQLFRLAPPRSNAHHVRCLVRRSKPGAAGGLLSKSRPLYELWLAEDSCDPHARFLLSARPHAQDPHSLTISLAKLLPPLRACPPPSVSAVVAGDSAGPAREAGSSIKGGAGGGAHQGSDCAELMGDRVGFHYALQAGPQPWACQLAGGQGGSGEGADLGSIRAASAGQKRKEGQESELIPSCFWPHAQSEKLREAAPLQGIRHRARSEAPVSSDGTTILPTKTQQEPALQNPDPKPVNPGACLLGIHFSRSCSPGLYETRPLRRVLLALIPTVLRPCCRRLHVQLLQSPPLASTHLNPKAPLLKPQAPTSAGRWTEHSEAGEPGLCFPPSLASAAAEPLGLLPGCRILDLHNVLPRWNPALQCWCLNFHHRVKKASVKNIQLGLSAAGADPWPGPSHILMQFGKVDKDVFALDFNPSVMTALQAFAVGLSSFGSKFCLCD